MLQQINSYNLYFNHKVLNSGQSQSGQWQRGMGAEAAAVMGEGRQQGAGQWCSVGGQHISAASGVDSSDRPQQSQFFMWPLGKINLPTPVIDVFHNYSHCCMSFKNILHLFLTCNVLFVLSPCHIWVRVYSGPLVSVLILHDISKFSYKLSLIFEFSF